MKTIKTTYERLGVIPICLGREEENAVLEIHIDVSTPLKEYPEAWFAIHAENPEGISYPVPAKTDNDTLIWTVSSSDTAKCGRGKAQVVMYGADGEIGRSNTATTIVVKSVIATGEAPEPMQNWLDDAQKLLEELKDFDLPEEQVEQIVKEYFEENPPSGGSVSPEQVQEAVNAALTEAKENGEFDGEPGKDGADGENGGYYTPYMQGTILKMWRGSKSNMPNVMAEIDLSGEAGADGSDGKDGADGVSPTVSVSAITGGHRITITDANGTKTVDVMDGSDGADGKDGVDGHTPVKGVDYFDGKDGQDGAPGATGSPGADGNGIASAVLNADYTLTLTFTDGTKYTTPSIRGATGADGSPGKDGSAGSPGKDGTSVTVKSVSESTADGGSNVITFSDGKTVTIKNGSKGSTGASGSNGSDGVGVSSVKQTTTSAADGGNNVVTVTLTNGTTSTFTVKNGSKGSTGAAGKTPVKGTDYWTADDQANMVQQVIAALPDASEVNY